MEDLGRDIKHQATKQTGRTENPEGYFRWFVCEQGSTSTRLVAWLVHSGIVRRVKVYEQVCLLDAVLWGGPVCLHLV